MAEYLSPKELAYKNSLKRQGILIPFMKEELMAKTRRGGVTIICSDNSIDGDRHIKGIIPTNIYSFFAGPLQFARSYGRFNEAMARGLVDTMMEGMEHKETQALFPLNHGPCGMAGKYRHALPFVVEVMVPEVNAFFCEYPFFEKEKIQNLIHFKILERDKIKQRSYFLNLY